MTTTIEMKRADLAKVLTQVAKIQPRKSPKPILQNCRIEVSEDGVAEISAHERMLDYSVRLALPCETTGSGVAVCDVHQLRKLVPKKGQVSIELGDRVGIAGGYVDTASPDEFPQVRADSGGANHSVRVDGELLRAVLDRCHGWTDSGSHRFALFALGGICLEFCGPNVHVVATDGRRLIASTIGLSFETPEQQVILPAKGCQILAAILAAKKVADVEIRVFDNSVEFAADYGMLFTMRQIEGRFPRWRAVLDRSSGSRSFGRVSANHLLDLVTPVVGLSSDDARRCDIRRSGANFALSYSNSDGAAYSADISADWTDETVLESRPVGLDCKFLRDLAKSMKDEQIEMFAAGSAADGIKSDYNPGDYPTFWVVDDCTAVIMPMEIED